MICIQNISIILWNSKLYDPVTETGLKLLTNVAGMMESIHTKRASIICLSLQSENFLSEQILKN